MQPGLCGMDAEDWTIWIRTFVLFDLNILNSILNRYHLKLKIPPTSFTDRFIPFQNPPDLLQTPSFVYVVSNAIAR